MGAPDHPHRGFETLTYVISGAIQHKDSAGNSGKLGDGWVQWMTAGSGVVHSEMPSDEVMEKGGRAEVFPAVGESAGQRQDGCSLLSGHASGKYPHCDLAGGACVGKSDHLDLTN